MSRRSLPIVPAAFFGVLVLAALPALAGDATVQGHLVANGKTVELPYVYVWTDEGFYDETDPTWKVLFVEHPIEERKLGDMVWDSAYVELGITQSSEFDDEPKLQVYSQSIRLSSESGGNLSGGTYPTIEIESMGPERFTGRVYHAEPQEFFDDTYQYDFTFSAPLSDPNAPIGDPLPADGGEPGRAYVAWCAALHSGDVAKIKAVVPPEMAAELDKPEAKEDLEFMVLMTPENVKVLGGSSDGETAIIEVEGTVEGDTVHGKVTLIKQGDHWLPTSSSWG